MQINKSTQNSAQLMPGVFQKHVLAWFDQHGRKTLPWQQEKTPYRVWVSEIMLQQTQVSTVIPYFTRFIARFPTIDELAAANADEVLHLWTGLGYYSRARNLHKTAAIVAKSGAFPDNVAELAELPGIGLSTAGAIVSIAFGKRATILDGNVKRVLTRLYGIQEWPGEKKTHDLLWQLAEKLTPTKRVADYTQAMMDIGATLCVRGTPLCSTCPLQKYCVAYQQGDTKNLPKKKPTVKIPTRQVTMLIAIKNGSHVLLEKRPSSGIWGGLWSLPEAPGLLSEKEIRQACRLRFNQAPEKIVTGASFRHTFSHFHLDITPVFFNVKEKRGKVMEAEQQIWYNLHQPDQVGLPAPVKKLLTSPLVGEVKQGTHNDPTNLLQQTPKTSRRPNHPTLPRRAR